MAEITDVNRFIVGHFEGCAQIRIILDVYVDEIGDGSKDVYVHHWARHQA